MAEFTNRLVHETSLYLKQHAHNPVDWYPWGPEALEQARTLDKPIFLSIGYSACHWCHVMEHECFEAESIAALMNEHFINIKVDREERPDLDQIYMSSHHVLNRGQGGGWPLSVFLSPDLTPFYAGTYYPPDDRYAPQRPSFPTLLLAIANAWETKRSQLAEIGQNVVGYLQQNSELAAADSPLSPELVTNGLRSLKRSFDSIHGGFGHAPKFPHPTELRLLLRIATRTKTDEAMQMVRLSLDKMARGGMYDQVGGGFARYSVDAYWLVPHFEKMLYDNALLTTAYVEAYQQTSDPFYRHIATETLDYVIREMTSPQGGFYSTQDADSEGEEGKFYVWSEAELESILGPELAELAIRVFGVTERGNFEHHNILFRSKTDEQDAKLSGLSVEAFREKLAEVKCKLYAVRCKRVWPGRDEKILTAWNGLMIAAFAQAGAAFDSQPYRDAATKAADFVLTQLRDANGRLFRTCGVGLPPKLTGYLEDYAYLCDALITLYESTFEPRWLEASIGLADQMLAHFADKEAGGFYFIADDHEKLITRTKELHDNATPAGNAVAVTALLRLAAFTGRADFAQQARLTLAACSTLMSESAMAAAQLLIALDFHSGPTDEIAVIGPKADPETRRVMNTIRSKFRPHQVVAFHDPADGETPRSIPLLHDKPMRDRVTVYVCRNFACQSPIVGADEIEKAFG